MGNTLYHYTGYAAFNGIIHDRELRINNILNMNDTEEMRLFFTGMIQALRVLFRNDGDVEKVERMNALEKEIPNAIVKYPAYAACFSRFRDDAAQWERYARKGRGVCIGFDEDVFRKFSRESLFTQEVFYWKDLSTHPIVSEVYERMKTLQNVPQTDPRVLEVVKLLWKKSTSFKHPSFRSEREVRLVYMPAFANSFAIKPQYHVSEDRIKKYYPLDIDVLCENAGVRIEDWITEIIIGPESSQSIQILQDYLEDNHLGRLADKVVHSNCPLRSKL